MAVGETGHLDPRQRVSGPVPLTTGRKKAGYSGAVSGPASADGRAGSRCVLGSFLCAAALWWPPRGPSREGQWQKKTQVAGASVRLKTHIPPTPRSRVWLCDPDVWHVGQWSHDLGHRDTRDRSLSEVTDELTSLLTGSSRYILTNSLGDKSSETAWCLWWWLDSLKEKSSPNWLFCYSFRGLPRCLSGEEYACDTGVAGDAGSNPGWEDPLEEGMATHSSIVAWRIPRTQEPGGLQFMGSQRVRHDWSDLSCTHAYSFRSRGSSYTLAFYVTESRGEAGLVTSYIVLLLGQRPWKMASVGL